MNLWVLRCRTFLSLCFYFPSEFVFHSPSILIPVNEPKNSGDLVRQIFMNPTYILSITGWNTYLSLFSLRKRLEYASYSQNQSYHLHFFKRVHTHSGGQGPIISSNHLSAQQTRDDTWKQNLIRGHIYASIQRAVWFLNLFCIFWKPLLISLKHFFSQSLSDRHS